MPDILWSELYPEQHLLSRKFYNDPGDVLITAPAGSAIIRVSLVGAGGAASSASPYDPGAGGGAAFARTVASAYGGETFTVRVGDPAHTAGVGDEYGNSFVRRGTAGTIICLAERGKSNLQTPSYGLASNSIGDVTRDGSAGVYTFGHVITANAQAHAGSGGASGSDEIDDFALGIGGRGQDYNYSAYFGGGGWRGYVAFDYDDSSGTPHEGNEGTGTNQPGSGQVCVEFFNENPGY